MIIENGAGNLTETGLSKVNDTIVVLKNLRQQSGAISLSGLFQVQPSNYYQILSLSPGWVDFHRTLSGILNLIDVYIRDLPGASTDADANSMIEGINSYIETWKTYTFPKLQEIRASIGNWVKANYIISNGSLVKKDTLQLVNDAAPTSQGSAIQQNTDQVVIPVTTTPITENTQIQAPTQKNTPIILSVIAAGLYFVFNR